MPNYDVTGIAKREFSDDRTSFALTFNTKQGETVSLSFDADHLEALLSYLIKLESDATLLNPNDGARPGETSQGRVIVVEGLSVQSGFAQGVPTVAVLFQSSMYRRIFVLSLKFADDLRQFLENNLKKRSTNQAPPRH